MSLLSKKARETPSSATVRIADQAKKMKSKGIDVVDFSAGRAVENTPAYISQAAAQALLNGDTHQTMARGKPEYLQACAQKLKRENGIDADSERSLIATMGIKQGLTLTFLTTLDPGDEVIVEDPCFVSYKSIIRFSGGIPVPVPLHRENRYRWTRSDLDAALTDRTKAILFCSPHNPTGTVHNEEDLDLIAQFAQKNDLLIASDEVYEHAVWRGRRHICMASLPDMSQRSITIMGMTKAYAMGGWRIGFIHASEDLITAMLRLQQHLVTCAASFTQTGAAKALSEEPAEELKSLWADWEKRCHFAAAEINAIPSLSCDDPEGGFYAWINISKTGETSEVLAERLLRDHHVAFIPGSAFGDTGEGYLRMTCVRSWEELREGLRRLKKALT